MRILLAAADRVPAPAIASALRASGHAVDRVHTGTEADMALVAHSYDLLVLDLGLPAMPGVEVLRRVRARHDRLPVLGLATGPLVAERIRSLELGADDCMAPPPALPEIGARVRALLRRSIGSPGGELRHGPLTYDLLGRMARIGGRRCRLSDRETGLLEVLLQCAGRPVGKAQFVEHLCEWGEEVSENAIEVYMHRLRRKLGPHGIRITTVRGLGYRLESPPAGD